MKSPKPIIGKRLGGEPRHELEHFIECPACGRWIANYHLLTDMNSGSSARVLQPAFAAWIV